MHDRRVLIPVFNSPLLDRLSFFPAEQRQRQKDEIPAFRFKSRVFQVFNNFFHIIPSLGIGGGRLLGPLDLAFGDFWHGRETASL